MSSHEAAIKKARLKLADRVGVILGIQGSAIVDAIREVPRHKFFPNNIHPMFAYDDEAFNLEFGEIAISEPTAIGASLKALDLEEGLRVLEVGTGTGYEAALIGHIVKTGHVFTLERSLEHVEWARRNLSEIGATNVTVIHRDGYDGYPEEAPYDRAVVAFSHERLLPRVMDQVRVGGIVVAPIVYSEDVDILIKRTKLEKGYRDEEVGRVIYVRMRRGVK